MMMWDGVSPTADIPLEGKENPLDIKTVRQTLKSFSFVRLKRKKNEAKERNEKFFLEKNITSPL